MTDYNGWQTFWRSVDEARLTVRIFMISKLGFLATYVWFVTNELFAVIDKAMASNGDAAWQNLTAILGAVTAFAGVTIPMLSKMYLEAWHDYRGSSSPLHKETE